MSRVPPPPCWKYYTPLRQIIEGKYSAVAFMKFNVGKLSLSHLQDRDKSADKARKLEATEPQLSGKVNVSCHLQSN